MADPIPRNSRADETAEFRRAEQERRGNRPLFGQNMGGGLRARVENVPPPVRPVAQPAAQVVPRPIPPQRPPQAQPRPLNPQAQRRGFVQRIVVYLRAAVDGLARHRLAAAPADNLNVWSRRIFYGSVSGILLVALAVFLFGGRGAPEAAATQTVSAAAPPMIPVVPPQTICTVSVRDVVLDADNTALTGSHALAAHFTIDVQGCDNQMVRSAVFVYQSENVPLTAPDADVVYRSPLGQLTAQTLHRVAAGETTIIQALAIPHAQFPMADGAQQWLTFGVQSWPEGRPAAAGSLVSDSQLFTRKP